MWETYIPDRLYRNLAHIIKPVIHPRRFHAYCVGMLKTGTHSLSAIFEDNYNAGHEIGIEKLAYNTVPELKKDLTKKVQTQFIKNRDKDFWLEIESSHVLFHSLDILVNEFPDSRFILTVRDCYSWMNSYMNHHLGHDDTMDFWWKLRRLNFRAGYFEHHSEEQILKSKGLYTVDGYLSYWADYNRKVLETVPEERLLVIRTDRIGDNLQKIADFLDIDASTLSHSKSHAFRVKKRYDVIWKIDRDFLESKVNQYCSDLMNRYFPEIESIEDAIAEHSEGKVT